MSKHIYFIEKANFINAAALVSALSSLIWAFEDAFKSPSSMLMDNFNYKIMSRHSAR